MLGYCRSILVVLALAAASQVRADNLLVVCPEGWCDSLGEWVAFREGQGHALRVVSAGERLPAPGPSEFGADAYGALLVGDGLTKGLAQESVSSRVVRRYGPEQQIASDAPLAKRYGASYAARLPFSEPAALRAYLRRVVQRECRPVRSEDDRVMVGAGTADFSPLIDATIEGVARRLLRDLAPANAEVTLRRFSEPRSPFPAPQPAPAARGGVWVWLGHGLRDRLPGIRPDELVEAAGGADLAVLIACYAGDVAARGPCVAEQLLHDPAGPVAVIAATRVSMPYGNARLGGELLAALSRSPADPVGRLFAAAKRASLTEKADQRLEGLDAIAQLFGANKEDLQQERREHAAMYHVLGDPLIGVRPLASKASVAPADATRPLR